MMLVRTRGIGDTSTTAGYWSTFFDGSGESILTGGGSGEAPGTLCADRLPRDVVDGVIQPCEPTPGIHPWYMRASSLWIGLGVGIFALAMLRGGRR